MVKIKIIIYPNNVFKKNSKKDLYLSYIKEIKWKNNLRIVF